MWQARRSLLEGTLLLKFLNFEFLVINNSREKIVPYRLQRKLSLSAECFSQKEKKLKVSEMPSPMKVMNPTDGGVATGVGSPLKRKLWADAATKENQNVRDVKPKLMFAKLSDKAHAPTKGSEVAAGYDLKSAYDYVVPKRGHILVKTDIQIKVPDGTYGRVAPRSGLALKNKIDVGAGVIDQDYRGNVGVILFNHGDDDFHISAGDRVAQLICEKIEYPEATEVESLDQTERGEGGFGSTGVKSQSQ